MNRPQLQRLWSTDNDIYLVANLGHDPSYDLNTINIISYSHFHLNMLHPRPSFGEIKNDHNFKGYGQGYGV
jgi:hypothetical protein